MKEFSLKRLIRAIKIRVLEIPHSIVWNYHPLGKKNKKNLRRFKDIYTGKRCFIVANGPSLNKTDLTLLSNEISIGLNRIYLIFDHSLFRPNFLVTINELILDQFSEEISSLPINKFINWNRRELFDISDSKTFYLKSKLVFSDSFGDNLLKPIVTGATVTFAALQIAYYMGFKEVILIGLDHNYSEKGIPNETQVRTSEIDKSHFNPNYFPKGSKWQVPDLLRSEIEYELARKVFEADNRKIFDATIGGKCLIFEKIDYISLF